MERRLAAITAVDVVGFSRLMAVDEEGTWAAWSDLRRVIDPVLEQKGGRIVKSTGDGVLVESPSIIEAVRAAIETQDAVRTWNIGRPEDRQMLLRIGVNLGDVIVADDGDLYGDGVNVAARLESLSPPGEVCVADDVYRQVRHRVDAPFRDLGERKVKNIPDPLHVWATGEPSPASDPTRVRPKWMPAAIVGVVVIAGTALAVAATQGGLGGGESTTTSEATTTTAEPSTTSTVAAIADVDWRQSWGASIRSFVVDLAESCNPTCRGRAYVALDDGTVRAVELPSGEESWERPFDVGAAGVGVVAVELVPIGGRLLLSRSGSELLLSVNSLTGSEMGRTLAPFEALGHPQLAGDDDVVVVAHGIGIAAYDGDLSGQPTWEEPLAVQSLVQHISVDGGLIAATDGLAVHALDSGTGRELWRVGPPTLVEPVWVLAQEVEVAGAGGRTFDRRALVLTAAEELVMVDESGSVVWRLDVAGPPGSPPADVVVVAGVDRELLAIDAASGEEVWVNRDLQVDGPPVVSGDSVFVVVDTSIVEVNLRSGNERGRVDLVSRPTGAIAAVGSQVIVSLGDTLVGVTP